MARRFWTTLATLLISLSGGPVCAKQPMSKAEHFARDRKAPTQRNDRDRRVWRYMGAKEAQSVQQRGLRSGKHMTSTASAGAPLTAANAKKREGLANAPKYRVPIRLEKGTSIAKGKVTGGGSGRGEIIARQSQQSWLCLPP